jgi:hypothetical protein
MLKNKREKAIFYSCAVFLFLLIAILTKSDVTMAGNESSRFGTIQALAEQNTFAINHTAFQSVDKIVINGKFYSDKPLPLMVVHGMMYKLIAALSGISFNTHYYLSIFLINLLGIGLLNIVLFILFFKRLCRDSEAPFISKIFLSVSLLTSTLLLSYGISMNNHTPAALLLWALFMQLMDYPGKNTALAAFLIGITAGGMFDLDIPTGGMFGLAAFAIVLLTSEERKLTKTAVYSIGGLLPIMVMGSINYIAFGRIMPQYFGAGGTYSPDMAWPVSVSYFTDILFGGRGFFSYMPAMLFVIPVLLFNRKIFKNRVESIILLTVVTVILFYGMFTNEYGGWAYGFRYLIPVIPVIWYFIAREYAPKIHSWQYGALVILILWGVVTSYVGAYNRWCNCYERERTPPFVVEYNICNTFAANLLCMSFEQDPESILSRFLIFKVYGQPLAVEYLNQAFVNTRKIDELIHLREYCRKYPALILGRK